MIHFVIHPVASAFRCTLAHCFVTVRPRSPREGKEEVEGAAIEGEGK